MAFSFSDLAFERKLSAMMVLTALLALLGASVVYGISTYVSARGALIAEAESLAEVIGTHSVAALEFGDAAVAGSTLESLALQKNIAGAALFDDQGQRLASYARALEPAELPEQLQPRNIERFEAGRLRVVREVLFDGRLLGAVYIESDLSALWDRMRSLAATLVGMLLVSVLMSMAIAARLQSIVSGPVLHLASTVKRVATEHNYSLRARKRGDDELGQLIDGFNEMIATIEIQTDEQANARLAIERHAEELARSNAELDDFAYIASHDLKEPLRGIHNYSRFLEEDYGEKLDDEGRQRLATLQRLTVRMETLIESLLHYSRVGRVDQAFGRIDLDAMLHDVLETLRPRLEECRVSVRIPRPLPIVHCDGVRVGEVFRNLLTNAIKYNESEDPFIEVSWSDRPPDPESCHAALAGGGKPGWPVFSVRDNGIGIREKHLEAVFRIFKRLHGRDKYGGGTGAGLSIVKKIVERHGGGLWVESTEGSGTVFHFSVGELMTGPEQAEGAKDDV